jgi:sugar O-acyltransferase (sialic acid O-acetyltransferase NeuD family)
LTNVILAGNAITAQIILGYLKRDTRYHSVAAVVDDDYVDKGTDLGIKCYGIDAISKHCKPTTHSVIMAAGYGDLNRGRQSLFVRLKGLGYRIMTYIHPDARTYSHHPTGEGSVVLPGAIIEPNAKIGANTMIWCNTTVAHDSTVGDHCWIASGAVIAGNSSVGWNTFIGVNATVVDQVKVAEYNIIGAAAMISKCTKPNTVHLARSAEVFRYGADEYSQYFCS